MWPKARSWVSITDLYSANTCGIFVPFLTCSYSMQHVPAAGRCPTHSSVTDAQGTSQHIPLRLRHNSRSPAKLHLTQRVSTVSLRRIQPVCGWRQQSLFHIARGFTSSPCSRCVAFPGRVCLYLKYLCSPQGFLHTVAQQDCKWGLVRCGCCRWAVLGAEVSVCTVQLPGTHESHSATLSLGHRPDFCPAV